MIAKGNKQLLALLVERPILHKTLPYMAIVFTAF